MEAAAEPHMVPGYRHVPGNHCGSTALRNLLAHHGLELSEEMAFGLGAGACFYYLVLEDASPTRWFNGRVARLEENFLEITGAPLALDTFEDPDAAWEAARSGVDEGRPALLLTDLYYLDHYGRSAHFPGHAVVLAGYDDELAYLSDTAFEELQETRIASLREARHGEHPAFPLQGHMFTVPEGVELPDVREAAPRAVERAAKEMLEPSFGEYGGLPAVRRLADEAGSWPEQTEDWQWCARFAYQVIERRGTGGGNFRLMYSRFLEEAGYAEQAPIAAEAAGDWTALAEAFREASELDKPEPGLWDRVDAAARACLDAEQRLWASLAGVD
ncbi:MAG: BtrH N-terminal domain-containing protein [Actinomycetota bacterium]